MRKKEFHFLKKIAFLAAVVATVGCWTVDSTATEALTLPDEELAKESVTPVFDRMVSLKNRNVPLENRIDIGGYYGWALTEPIANVSKLGLNLYYHTDEEHAWGIFLNKNFTGLSGYAKQLDSQFTLDFERAPKPELTAMVDYNILAFYGKMSITKQTVLNLNLYGSLAAGVVKYQHKTYPALAPGLGQKFYLTNQLALRFDLRLFIHQAPVPFKPGAIKKSDPVPNYSEFEERITYTTVLDIGLSYLF